MQVTVILIVVVALQAIQNGFVKRLEELENGGQAKIIKNYSIIEVGQNTEKNPGDLMRLAVSSKRLDETCRLK